MSVFILCCVMQVEVLRRTDFRPRSSNECYFIHNFKINSEFQEIIRSNPSRQRKKKGENLDEND